MKTLKEFFGLSENTDQERLEHQHTGDFHVDARVFVDSYIKPEHQTWLTKHDPKAVETTVDLNQKEKKAHLNFMIAHHKGKGYGQETMRHVIGHLQSAGFKKLTGYVEHNNAGPLSMINKAGFKRTKYDTYGSYYEKDLSGSGNS